MAATSLSVVTSSLSRTSFPATCSSHGYSTGRSASVSVNTLQKPAPAASCHLRQLARRHPAGLVTKTCKATCSAGSAFDQDGEICKDDQEGARANHESTGNTNIVNTDSFQRRSFLNVAAISAATAVLLPAISPPASASVESGTISVAAASEVTRVISGAQSVSVLPLDSKVTLSILGDCGLGVSVYPDFVYNPKGGGGVATVSEGDNGKLLVKFDPLTLNIPRVEGKTTSLLGAPLPPPIRIDIVPEALEGFIDRNTGQVELTFLAKFFFSLGPLYKPPPLLVTTVLTTEFSTGVSRSAQGERMDSEGKCVLVGTARVPPINDTFLDNFLMLPTDVLAVLPSQFKIVNSSGEDTGIRDSSELVVALSNGQYDLYHRLLV